MKRIIIAVIFAAAGICSLQAQQTEINGCSVTAYHGSETTCFEAYGDVFVLTNELERADLDVKITKSKKYATYKVFRCTDKPQKCGEWRFVADRKKAKFTIRFVTDDWEDCTIYFTDNRTEAGF